MAGDQFAGRHTGTAHLPLHYGRAPRWLFERMIPLAREITLAIVTDFGPAEMLRRLAEPGWFQALGCVLGFDWHSSGLTTTVCGALKEGLKEVGLELGLFVCGGKGATSRRTPAEIEAIGERISLEPAPLIYASRLSAKVDNNALQDGYQLYHHSFFFTSGGAWAVIQQGMNEQNRLARRYHWLREGEANFVNEPHTGIIAQAQGEALNLVAAESDSARQLIPQIAAQERPEQLRAELSRLQELELPRRHEVLLADISPRHVEKVLLVTYERQAPDFETLLGLPGVGGKTLRALSLVAEIIYGVPTSHRDPARFSFAHGGKDGHPYPVNRPLYDKSIAYLEEAVRRAKVGQREKLEALRRLARWDAITQPSPQGRGAEPSLRTAPGA